MLTSFTTKINTKNTKKPTVTNNTEGHLPILKKDFNGFKEALAFKESQGKYKIINKIGYLGKYQFGKTTLRHFKIYNTQKFLRNPELQEKAFLALCKVNKAILQNEIKKYSGKMIRGVHITESGILAAAHLGGARRVKKYLHSYGKKHFKDAFGTSITTYMKKFEGYDLSFIEPNLKARI